MFYAQSNVKDHVIRARHRPIPTKVHILIHYYILNIHILIHYYILNILILIHYYIYT